MGIRGRNLANTIEGSVLGGGASCRYTITVASCFFLLLITLRLLIVALIRSGLQI